MNKSILITGGAGFIGSHLADRLIALGCRVRALDNLTEQVHGRGCMRPEYLNPEVELVVGDVRDASAVEKSLAGVDAVYHLAAAVGVGQSMYEIDRYTDVNLRGTAVLLEAIAKRPVERLIVASSMSIYGEGSYVSRDGRDFSCVARRLEDIRAGRWEALDENGAALTPRRTPESKAPSLCSIYALTKYAQESACMIAGRAYSVPTAALRFFNVFGARQSFSNPYTGVLAIFSSRLINGSAPLLYEDGGQMRDFVSVHDVVQACVLALEKEGAAGGVFNIGSGRSTTVLEAAVKLAGAFGKDIRPEVTGKYRMGDIRHCFADITRAKAVLGYEPGVTLEEGARELSLWIEGKGAPDRFHEAGAELADRGLTI